MCRLAGYLRVASTTKGVFLLLANGVTLRFLLEVATVQLSSWCVGSLSLSLACDISMLSAFFSEYVESVALFIKYVSPELVIFIGGICTVSRFVNGRLLCRFLFSLAALSLEHCFARPFRSPAQAELKSIYVYRVHSMIRIMGVKRIFI